MRGCSGPCLGTFVLAMLRVIIHHTSLSCSWSWGGYSHMAPLKMKEPANAWTHFVTLIVASVSLPFLIALTSRSIKEMLVVTAYGLRVIALYGASTLYHWRITTPRRGSLRRLDHGASTSLCGTAHRSSTKRWAWRMAMLVIMFEPADLQVVFIEASVAEDGVVRASRVGRDGPFPATHADSSTTCHSAHRLRRRLVYDRRSCIRY